VGASIRAGDGGHRTPKTVCMKPGSGSPLSLVGSGGEPNESSETRTSLVVPVRGARDNLRRINPPASAALPRGVPRVRHTATTQSVVCAPAPRSRSVGIAARRRQTGVETSGQRRVRLIAHRARGELHDQSTHMPMPGARDALIVHALPALIRGRHQSHQAAQLATILNLPPAKQFRGQGPRADRTNPAQRGQAVDRAGSSK
jgi:hypothetical protein